MVWAFIEPIQGTEIKLKDVMKHCRSESVNYMVPDQVRFIDEIPRKPGVGKIDYETLIKMAKNEIDAMNGGNDA